MDSIWVLGIKLRRISLGSKHELPHSLAVDNFVLYENTPCGGILSRDRDTQGSLWWLMPQSNHLGGQGKKNIKSLKPNCLHREFALHREFEDSQHHIVKHHSASKEQSPNHHQQRQSAEKQMAY